MFHCGGLNIISDTHDGEVQCLLCACAVSSMMGQCDAVLQLWPEKTKALLFISTTVVILDQKLLFS